MDANAALAETLRTVGPQLDAARCRWTVISSAAVAVHTGNAAGVGDVDVLLDEAGASAAFSALGLPLTAGQGTDLFRSRYFGQWLGSPLTVELFAGFSLFRGGVWSQIEVADRREASFRGARVFVPEAGELAAMLRSFGRDKDLKRAALLSPSGPSPSRPGIA